MFGLFVLWHVQGFPAMPGQKFGPALFPGLLAAGVGICGVLLIARGARSGAEWISFAAWTHLPRPVAAFASVIVGLALYVVIAEPLGFHLTGFLLVLGWALVFGARPSVAIPVALLAPILIHLAFYKLLRIPLPWGVLERFAF